VDAVPPEGSVLIEGGRETTRTRLVTLRTRAGDPQPGSGVLQMRLRNGGGEWGAWRAHARRVEWRLSPGEGKKKVLAQYRDGAGNVSAVARDSIVYRRR